MTESGLLLPYPKRPVDLQLLSRVHMYLGQHELEIFLIRYEDLHKILVDCQVQCPSRTPAGIMQTNR